jgi:Marseilleviridae restriction endonuclease
MACSGKSICKDSECKLCFHLSFASHEKSEYWSEKNDISARSVYRTTAKKYLFNCPNSSHEFLISLNSIVFNNAFCSFPCCGKGKLCEDDNCKMCFDASFASSGKASYWSDKNDVNPRSVNKGTDKKYWFKCKKSNHDFLISPNSIATNNSFCAFPCCGNQKLCDNDKCKLCFNASFASSDKAKYWSDKNVILPRNIFKSSGKKYLFKCEKGHEFEISLSYISKNKLWCSYFCCSGRILCNDDRCKICFDASFASHEKIKYFSDKNIKIPRQICKGTRDKYWFKCSKSNHEFKIALCNITSNNSFCPFPCCGNQKLCPDDKCDICFKSSFASHSKFELWSKNNIDENGIFINPRSVFKCSGKQYKFNCQKHGDYIHYAIDVSNYNSGCPRCIRINETECISILEKITEYEFKKRRPLFLEGLELDGYNEKLKLAIEYNGGQHYKYVKYYHKNGEIDFEKQQKNDAKKIKLCQENNIYLIIVPYWIKDKEIFIKEEYNKYLVKNKKI